VQERVRLALKHLHVIMKQWKRLGVLMHLKPQTVKNAAHGYGCVSASIAFRVARMAGISVDELLAGRFPPR
jgi:plasmid maintenance system antidote protein VapI